MRLFLICCLFCAVPASAQFTVQTGFEPVDNFPNGTGAAGTKYNFTTPVTDSMGNLWTGSATLQTWKFATGSGFVRDGSYSLWLKNGSTLILDPAGATGAGTLRFYAMKVSFAGNPFTVKVSTSPDGTTWTDVYTRTYQISEANVWQPVEVPLRLEDDVKIRFSSEGIDANDKGILVEEATLTAYSATSAMAYLSGTTEHVGYNQVQTGSSQVIARVKILTENANSPIVLSSMTISLPGTRSLSDVGAINVYYTATDTFGTATKFNTAPITPQGGPMVTAGSQALAAGSNYLWIAFDIKTATATGSYFDASCLSLTMSGPVGTKTPTVTSPAGRKDYFRETVLFRPGDLGVPVYRIPALTTTKNGTIIAACDARHVDSDLGAATPIDIIIRKSTDTGNTWDSAKIIAHLANNEGCSDPALVTDRETGTVWCLFASRNGLFGSTPADRIEVTAVKSDDNGQTWSSPVFLSNQVYLTGWYAAWVASGAAHQTRNGRLCAAVGVRETSAGTISNFMICSDDHGSTWHTMANRASPTGDEAKLLELNNGTMMINIRNSGSRKINVSTDSGKTWGTPYLATQLRDPACDADFIRFTSTLDGYTKNRILFSNPDSTSRNNLTIKMSYDEASTWPFKRVIFSGPSAYSALSILKDGSIGVYYEKGSPMQMVFAKFTLEELTDGADTLLKTNTGASQESEGVSEANSRFFHAAISKELLIITCRDKSVRNTSAKLLDSKGRAMRSTPITEWRSVITISGLPHGLYFLIVRHKAGKWTGKIFLH